MKRFLYSVPCIFSVLIAVSPQSATADLALSSDFSSGSLPAGMQDPDSAYTISGGVVFRTSSTGSADRRYIRATDTDYFSSAGDFAYEISFTNLSGTIQFIGIGNGERNGAFSNEPGPASGVAGTGFGALNLRIHSPDIASGRIDWAFNHGVMSEQVLTLGIGNIFSYGTHRARISTAGDLVTLAIDENYSGSFTSTISTTIDLNLPAYAAIKTALLNEARPFFGTANTGILYDDLSITVAAVPEAAAWQMFALVTTCVASVVAWRKWRQVNAHCSSDLR